MKAAVWRGPAQGHVIETVSDPAPGPNEVVVRVERSGVCGSDMSFTKERQRPTLLGPVFEAAYNAGAILGHEFCGTVVATGAEVGHTIGERYSPMFFHGCGRCASCLTGTPQGCDTANWFMGGYAQFALLRTDFAVKLPAELSADDGALIEPLATSLCTARAGGIAVGDRVLVLGAGALGLGVTYFARLSGASKVVNVARTDSKADAARRVGADSLIASGGSLSPEEVTDVMGGPPDVVFETAGAPGLVDTAFFCVRTGGTIVVAGLCLDPESTSHAIAAMKNLTVRYTTAYSLRDFETVVEMMTSGSTPKVDLAQKIVGLGEFSEFFEANRSGAVSAKLMLDPWRS
jgi:2-desacetyl-2-hydroxyethyl bacteriochlorophyllide A dehydrogenase